MNGPVDACRLLFTCIPKYRTIVKKRVYRHLAVTTSLLTRHSTTLPASPGQSDVAYCVDLVRFVYIAHNLGTLLLPKNSQRAAFALRAYNVELAQVPDSVSDKKIGLIRMQFWKDAIQSIYQSSPPKTPVATELSGACGYYRLSKHWLERLVEARAAQMERDSFTSVKHVEDYAEQVNSSLYYLLLECLGIKNVHADHAASHLGKAQGIVTLLRATPHHASRRRVYLPMEVLAKPLKDAVFEVASLAHQHLEKARSLQKNLPDKSHLVFLNAHVCDHYLKNLQKVDFNVFEGKLQRKNPLLAYHMYFNKLRRKF
ncbi:unnamed protein product [Candidula unifasciata]|uniref:NADH dehydrogenase (Ubiquinone) complex I, assembly factor 6 n=1 Tax=Candidula unifasciata TaxID=100452 RepID=A0A8S3YLZ5_9EUPU|nr:unnamed protein product [Candidula unifasciata]